MAVLDQVTVTVPRRLLDRFIRRAKQAAPLETYGILIGSSGGGRAEIVEIFIPEDQQRQATPDKIVVEPSWIRRARRLARSLGASVIGDIHSHVGDRRIRFDCSPSESDWDHLLPGVLGICAINSTSNGKMRARVRFWSSPVVKTKTRLRP